MRNFMKHKTAIFLIGATLIIAILIGIFGAVASKEVASLSENAVGTVAEPGHAMSSGIGGWFSNIFTYFGSVKNLREEVAALEKENIDLDKKVRKLQGMEKENERLRAMVDLVEEEKKLDVVAARVIAKDPSNWYSSFTINKGTKDGIKKNQAVFTGNYELIGRVYKVGNGWAEIITVLDPDSSVGCTIERTKDIGVLEGDSSLRLQGLCRLGYLSRDAEISVGDYVETSGLGGIYPKGLLVGKITEVQEDNATMSKYATVEPIADIERVREVFVLRSFSEEIKPEVELKEKEDRDNSEQKKESSSSKDNEESESKDEKKSESKDDKKDKAKDTSKETDKATAKSDEKPAKKPEEESKSEDDDSESADTGEMELIE